MSFVRPQTALASRKRARVHRIQRFAQSQCLASELDAHQGCVLVMSGFRIDSLNPPPSLPLFGYIALTNARSIGASTRPVRWIGGGRMRNIVDEAGRSSRKHRMTIR
jgi:hypothetical protein